MYEHTFPEKRYQKTLEFLKEMVPPPAKVLDLGVENPFSEIMTSNGYEVTNTLGEDLDDNFESVQSEEYDLVAAFEIFEHLLAPYNILREIKAKKIIASVPLKLWFAPAYQSKTDKWDRHYHEFEDWQFDWLFEKSGWQIKKTLKWTNPVNKFGVRPILRKFTARYYAVYAEKS